MLQLPRCGSCPWWQLSWVKIALGGSCPMWQVSWVAIVLDGSCPSGSRPGGNCPGGCIPNSGYHQRYLDIFSQNANVDKYFRGTYGTVANVGK